MENFTPLPALAGGALIGLASATLWLLSGRLAGCSGILGGILFRSGDRAWRLAFVAGLVGGGAVMRVLSPEGFGPPPGRSFALVAIAGVLVGVGTALANGCTSGHGVCGISRFSKRSIAATLTFMATGALAVAALRWLGVTS
jgi:uncharacterized membrane protein YedE/YeeE